MRPILVGVLGAGRQGRIHIDNLAHKIKGATLAAVADISPQCLGELSLPGVALYENFDNIFKDPSIDAVVIASATDSHADMIVKASKAGKHIFCEKPVALSTETIDRALDEVNKSGVKFQIGLNRRFDPTITKISSLVHQGRIGTPHILAITSRDPAPPPLAYLKVCGGFFLDTTVHDFDTARYCMGDEVKELYATGGALQSKEIRELGDMDTAMVLLKFQNGAVGSINNSRKAAYGFDQRVEVFGEKGALACQNQLESSLQISDEMGSHVDRNLLFFTERYQQSFCIEIQGFIDSIVNDTPTLASARDAKISVTLAMAARESWQSGKPVVIDYSWANK